MYNAKIAVVRYFVYMIALIIKLQLGHNAKTEEVLSECIVALVALESSKSLISSIVDMLLSFVFHSITLPAGWSSYEWFFRAALPGSPVPLLEYISLAQYKYYLLIILEQQSEQSNRDPDDVLKLFKPEVSYILHYLLISLIIQLRSLTGELINSVDHDENLPDIFYSDKASTSIYQRHNY